MSAIGVYDNWHCTIVYPTKVNTCVLLVVTKGYAGCTIIHFRRISYCSFFFLDKNQACVVYCEDTSIFNRLIVQFYLGFMRDGTEH